MVSPESALAAACRWCPSTRPPSAEGAPEQVVLSGTSCRSGRLSDPSDRGVTPVRASWNRPPAQPPSARASATATAPPCRAFRPALEGRGEQLRGIRIGGRHRAAAAHRPARPSCADPVAQVRAGCGPRAAIPGASGDERWRSPAAGDSAVRRCSARPGHPVGRVRRAEDRLARSPRHLPRDTSRNARGADAGEEALEGDETRPPLSTSAGFDLGRFDPGRLIRPARPRRLLGSGATRLRTCTTRTRHGAGEFPAARWTRSARLLRWDR